MDIAGLGPVMAVALVEAGLVRSPADLYRLEHDALVALPGVGERTAERLRASIAESRGRELARVLVALGVPGLGPVGAKTLAAGVGDVDGLLAATRESEGAWDAAGQRAWVAWRVDPVYREQLAALRAVGVTGTRRGEGD
jgi:DNA ligase (NAD+)